MKDILLNILAPILLMVSLGSLMRWKFKLDMGTLGKLNIYLFVPAFIFHNVSTSTLRAAEMLVLTAGVPTAVNTLLVTLELDGDAELAADCVFWTTLVSCFTITAWLVAVTS
jgi:predicted permease